MKLVLDTNVLIAALIACGVCADLLEHCVLSHRMVASDFILSELRGRLVGKLKYTDQDADDAIALFAHAMISPASPSCRSLSAVGGCLPLPHGTLVERGHDD